VKGTDKDLWKEAIEKKLSSLDKAGIYDVIEREEGIMEVDSKLVYKIKRLVDSSINKFKACLIARGFT
jgi:hypothetical protein